MLECLERDMGAELDRAGDLADHVDLLAPAKQERVVGRRRAAGVDDLVEPALGIHGRRLDAGVLERLDGSLRTPVRDTDDAHARNAVHDLVRQPLPHEPGADDADADGASLGFALLERSVDDDHAPTSIRLRTSGSTESSNAHCLSFSDITVTGSGHSRPSRGSSGARPPSASGV